MDRRDFLMTAVAGGALAAASAAFAEAKLEGRANLQGQATRTSAQAVRLDWAAPRQPTSIFVSTDPDAQKPYMRALKTGVRGGRAELPLPVSPRPYFLLSTAEGGQVRVAERLLPLQGGRNFRDLGGYRSADGRQVRWGRIYRSGVMAGLTTADMSYLSGLGIEVICDLRSQQERTAQPNPFTTAESPLVVGTDYDMLAMPGMVRATNRAEAIEAFADAYVDFTDKLSPQYTDMFARLVRRETPLAFNCSAGKDRTGVAAALILSVLDVPRDAILADYALTEVYSPPRDLLKAAQRPAGVPGIPPERAKAFARMPPEVIGVMLGSNPAVMRQALAKIDDKFGGPVALAKARFGLSDATIAYLRGTYLI
jgi:protein-tyrosine phosphatase